MPPVRHWTELTTEDFRRLPMSETIAVLPVAAVEQHGPHLPVGTDTLVMRGYLDRAMARLPRDLPVLFLPIQSIGLSSEHVAFPGTLTLSAATAIAAWTEIGASVHRAGCCKLVIVNAHGGNVPVVDIVARDLRARHGLLVVTASWHRFGHPEGFFEPAEVEHGIHGGDVETSLMLAFRPDLVRTDKAENFAPRSLAMARELALLRPGRPAGFGWMAQDLHPSGAIGNAAAATRDKGEAMASHGAEAFVALLKDVARFDLAGG